ncbi:MAG: nucleotide-binding universal stress UspA family protein [Bacteroidia bacterium]|jgi:nucleotide-binding universal stress UspA family protein
MKHILCPTDFSLTAENACFFAAKIAKKLSASLVLVNAQHVPIIDAYTPPDTVTNLLNDNRKAAETQMHLLRHRVLEYCPGIQIETVVDFGLASDIVVDFSNNEKTETSLIIMGTKGATNAMDVMMGTTASAVASKASVPTLVVPEKAEFEEFKKAAYATDYTKDTDQNLARFLEFMAPFNAKCMAVHILKDSVDSNEMLNIIAHSKSPISVVNIPGENIVDELNDFIWNSNIDVMALKRHKRNFWESLFHTSITKRMVYHSKVPVLILN